MWGLGKGIENGKSHFSQLAQFDGKILFHFTPVQQLARLVNVIKWKAPNNYYWYTLTQNSCDPSDRRMS